MGVHASGPTAGACVHQVMAATPNKRKAARKPAKGKAPETKADKLKRLLIEKGGINKDWADKHLVVI